MMQPRTPSLDRAGIAGSSRPGIASTVAGILLAVLTGCGAPQDPDPRALFVNTGGEQTGELLIGSAPEGWVPVSGLNQGTLRIVEYVDPAKLTPDQVDSVRLESQAGQPLPDPIDFLLGMREELKTQCQGIRDFPIFAGFENGYPTSVRLMLCRQKGTPPRGEVRMVKAIQGTEQFYIVSRSRSSAPFAPEDEPMTVEDMAVWSTWIGGITVCNTRDATHPCPAL